ncbi:MAG: FmdB family transcriptional regulator [Thermoleophilaceae bacterium]|nr:FmdB family transcriptional regulator [Thermoleophilaceae bacterium]
MPVYEYRCENGHEFEVLQRMTESSLTECTVCGAPVQRVFHAPAIHFKGSGFYNTDYGRKRGGGSSETDGSNGGDSKGEKKSEGASKSADGAGSGSSDSKPASSDSKASSTKAPEAA